MYIMLLRLTQVNEYPGVTVGALQRTLQDEKENKEIFNLTFYLWCSHRKNSVAKAACQ